MIKYSFKKAEINLNLKGQEDILFNWPKQPEMILIEEIKNYSQKIILGIKLTLRMILLIVMKIKIPKMIC